MEMESPTKKVINNVKNRFLPIPEAVAKGLEPEPKITDFEKLKVLGAGSFGKVYLVEHKITKCQYAIKEIDKTNKVNIEEQPYFRREIEIMYKIHHPNVVRLFGHFEDERNCYFIMEYISKGNIYNLVEKSKGKKPNMKQIASIMRDIISAVYFLHNMNPPIVHRDIKPENVLLDEGGVAKLTDFGWSNYMRSEEKRTTVCGTPIYLAPEIINEKGHDERVDIWCLGVLLFELCSGNIPFKGDDMDELKFNISHMNISWPRDMNTDTKNLISKILKEDPNNRISIPEMLKLPFFTKNIVNPLSYLVKPEPNLIQPPFIVSKDNPILAIQYSIENFFISNKIREVTKENEDLKKGIYLMQNNFNGDINKKLEKDKEIIISQKEELNKECQNLENKIAEQDKKIENLLKIMNNPLLDSRKEEQNEKDIEQNLKISELEKENENLKEKVEKYTNIINENNLFDKKMDEIRESITSNNDEKFMDLINKLRGELDENAKKYFIFLLNEKEKEIQSILLEQKQLRFNQKEKYNILISKYEKKFDALSKENADLKNKIAELKAK